MSIKEEQIKELLSSGVSPEFLNTLGLEAKYVQKYLKSDKEFDIRFAVVMYLDYFITDKYVDKVIKDLNNISHEGYYVKMAVAWCLCEIGIKFNDKFMEYMSDSKNNKLDKLKAIHECFGLYKYEETEDSEKGSDSAKFC